MEEEQVVLVDANDNEIGVMDKMQAHKEGRLHRAVSVLIFNSEKQLLLQKRAASKYHSPGLWTNTCCSHPRANEPAHETAVRRLHEEMGITCPLEFKFSLTYKAHLDNGLIEHEFDYIYVGQSDAIPEPNPEEVSEWRYADMGEILKQIKSHPDLFTPWFKLIMDAIEKGELII